MISKAVLTFKVSLFTSTFIIHIPSHYHYSRIRDADPARNRWGKALPFENPSLFMWASESLNPGPASSYFLGLRERSVLLSPSPLLASGP